MVVVVHSGTVAVLDHNPFEELLKLSDSCATAAQPLDLVYDNLVSQPSKPGTAHMRPPLWP